LPGWLLIQRAQRKVTWPAPLGSDGTAVLLASEEAQCWLIRIDEHPRDPRHDLSLIGQAVIYRSRSRPPREDPFRYMIPILLLVIDPKFQGIPSFCLYGNVRLPWVKHPCLLACSAPSPQCWVRRAKLRRSDIHGSRSWQDHIFKGFPLFPTPDPMN